MIDTCESTTSIRREEPYANFRGWVHDLGEGMIRVALAIAWREVRLVAYRAAAIHALTQREPWRSSGDVKSPLDHRLDAAQRHEIAVQAEGLARAMLDAEGRR